MQTGYKVTWTDRASKNVDEIIEYLEVQWDKKTANNFLADLHERVQLIAHNPEMFQESTKQANVRRSVLTKQVTLYYRFDGQHIEILFLFDTRQDPDKLRL